MEHQSRLQSKPRIQSLDIIRGFALLGILVMNIQSFSMPEAAYLNPTAYGDLNGINKWVWIFSHIFFDTKFYTLFSMLFGAGILLFCQHLLTEGKDAFRFHSRRMFWLLLLGFTHAHLIWSGDILFTYAACGFLAYFFRNKSTTTLWVLGLLLLSTGWLFVLLTQMSLSFMPDADISDLKNDWMPSSSLIANKLSAMTGLWSQQFELRTENSWFVQTWGLLFFFIWRIGGLMLIGMALFKQGVFTGKLKPEFLLRTGLAFLSLGIITVGYGVAYNFKHNWAFEFSQFGGTLFNATGSLLVAIGYIYLLALVVQKQWLPSLTSRLAYVGRMALTNYISQSLICTFIFYGFGLGLFGSVDRWQQLLIVFFIWALQLTWSPLWLKRFRYGPLEWLWRTLTYWGVRKLTTPNNTIG